MAKKCDSEGSTGVSPGRRTSITVGPPTGAVRSGQFGAGSRADARAPVMTTKFEE